MSKERKLVIYTGLEGMRLVDLGIKRTITTTLLESLYTLSKITPEEYDSYQEMIESEDERDFQLARIVLEHKVGWEQT